jgi:hypothetical protein
MAGNWARRAKARPGRWFRVELLIEPVVEAHGADGFEIAGAPGAEGEAIEGMEDALVALQLAGLSR